MKKYYLLLIVSLFVATQLVIAGPIDETAARQSTLHFMNEKLGNTRGALNDAQLARVSTVFNHLFIYNIDGGGFVIVGDDDRTQSVLAYSTTGSFNVNDMAPALAIQLEKYDVQLKAIAEGAEVVPFTPHRNNRSVAPLIQTRWNQWSPDGTRYNSMCPADSTLPARGYRATAGCVATAMAQVMKYWNWPLHGRGSNCYSRNYDCWHYGTLCADFESATYDWGNMPNQLADTSSQVQKDAVGLVLYHCGVALNTKYNVDCQGSSATNMNAEHFALSATFKYNHSLHINRFGYSDAEWMTLIKNDLDSGRPILYGGTSVYDPVAGTFNAGHSFIFDGYDENDYVHVNWGWGGSYDGYFSVWSLAPQAVINFSHGEEAIFGLQPDYEDNELIYPILCSDVTLDTNKLQVTDNVRGHVDIYNPNDTTISFYAAQAIYADPASVFEKWIDVQHLTIPAGDTLHYSFNAPVEMPVGYYFTSMFFSQDTIDISATSPAGVMPFPRIYSGDASFMVVDTNRSSMTNLVIFVRFAGEEEITYPFATLDSMFNCKAEGYPSIYNYFDVSTYGRIHFNTVYGEQVVGTSICSYEDEHPRGYYQPYSETNPIGYYGENPQVGISMREAQLLASAMDYVDSLELIDSYTVLDGNDDSYIDNISFIVKGDVDTWGDLLWPHMEIFPQDSIDHLVTINGKRPRVFNFEFEGSSNYFTTNTFRHEMSHSLGLPDLYHYNNYTTVPIASTWDAMAQPHVWNHTNMMHKSQYLHVADEPVQITEDGTYTIYSNATSGTQSSFIIKSALDSTQWFAFEYRNQNDLFDEGIPGTGLIAGRWNTNVPVDMYANMLFDNDSILHQYWIFRPGSNCDTVAGDINNAYFSAAAGRTSFGPTTNPHPYLADGTVENSFEITDIQENGEYLTFHVHFLNVGVNEREIAESISVYPNPATTSLAVIIPEGHTMDSYLIFDAFGRVVAKGSYDGDAINIQNLTPGLFVLKMVEKNGKTHVQKFVKQ